MENCIFCKIIQGVIPASKVYEDEEVLAFLDITQVTAGHTLLIPKKHVTDIFEYDEHLASKVFTRLPKIARAIEQAFPDIKGLNVVNNNREIAYQSVFHSHIHLIPRYSEKDHFSITFGDNSSRYDGQALADIAEKISLNIEK